jgi:glycosyltransferase involved in cell wall biosynthesis
MTTTTLTVGYLHVGGPQHGVARYGRLLAAEAQRRPELRVCEAEVVLDGSRPENHGRLARAAEALSEADVVHMQYNAQLVKSVWGPGWSQIDNLWTFLREIPAPLAVTLHDLPPPTGWVSIRKLARTKVELLIRRRLERLLRLRRVTTVPSFALRSKVRLNLHYAVTLGWLARRCRSLLVCSQEECTRLTGFLPSASVSVIPHFVEERVLPLSREDAKLGLGLQGMQVVTLLGYIHPRKGHSLLVAAMRELPGNVHVVMAGGAEPHHADYLQSLRDSARASGVSNRLRITGYLTEPELELYLTATDVAVCPFRNVAASGSVSTWLSAGRRIIASELPQIAEYNNLERGAIETFSPHEPTALAAALLRILETDAADQLTAIARLRDRLQISRVLDAHLNVYRQIHPPARRPRGRVA